MTAATWGVIGLTVKVALIATIITLPIAIWLGWVLARKKIPGKVLLEGIITLPLVAPPVVTGYLLLLLLGRNGVIGGWLHSIGLDLTFNMGALVIASVVVSLPLAVRAIRGGFELIDPAYEAASRTLGASKIATFFRVTLPMAFPGILSGIILTFTRSLGEFGATITLAGNIPGETQTISLMVYAGMQTPGMEGEVTALVIISLLISLGAIIISEIITKRRRYLK